MGTARKNGSIGLCMSIVPSDGQELRGVVPTCHFIITDEPRSSLRPTDLGYFTNTVRVGEVQLRHACLSVGY